MKRSINTTTGKSLFFVFLVLFLVGEKAYAAPIEVLAQISNNSFSVEEVAQLTVTVTGTRKAEIIPPEVDGLAIHNRGSQRSMKSVNGKTTFSFSTVYMVQALSEGTYTIPPITVSVKGENYSSEPITLEIIQTSGQKSQAGKPRTMTTQQNGPDKGALAFVQFIPKKTDGYIGEIIPIEIKAYFRTEVKELSLPILQGESFILPPLSREPQQSREAVNGVPYNVVSWDSSLSGVKEGAFPGTVTLDATLLLRRARPNDPFGNRDPFGGSLFDDFFSNSFQSKPVQLKSETVNFTILPLPATAKPESFSGAIGQFSIKSAASPHSIELGEPITLQLEIVGKGNFDRVQCPVFPDQNNFKVYQATSETASDGFSKTFEQAIVPKNANITEIPSLSFTFFDPEQKQYVTIHSNPLPLNIKSGALPVSVPQTTVKQPAATVAPPPVTATKLIDNLAPQKLENGNFHASIEPLIKKVWFLALILLFICMLIVFAGLRYSRQNRLNNPAQTRKKQATAILADNLQGIRTAQAEGDSTKLLAACRAAIQNQAGFILKQEPTAITQASLRQHHAISDELISLFEYAEQGAYGGQMLDSKELEGYVNSVINELEELQ